MTWRAHIVSDIAISVTAHNLCRMSVLYEPLSGFSRLEEAYFLSCSKFWLPLLFAVSFLGAIFPDIDKEDSKISRMLHFSLPFEHRTVMHSIWALCPLVWLGFHFIPAAWFAAGYATHLIADAFSNQGICFFWPIDHYEYFGSIRTKPYHFIGFYHTGTPSEWVMAGAFCSAAVLTTILWMLI